MRKNTLGFLLLSVVLSSSAFADAQMGGAESKPCVMVAKACKSSGMYQGKGFWTDCMKPVILGKEVKGVKVEPSVVKTCRENKITRMKAELAELESVQ